jgi:hypothetical protein
MKGPNFPLFFRAFMGKENLSRKNKIIVIVITVAFLGSLIAAGQYVYGQ